MKQNVYYIGTDIGTSATKSVLVSVEGSIIASDTAQYSVLTPHPLWAEQWPDVWFGAVIKTIRNVIEKSKIPKENIHGLTISGLYGGSGIPCDKEMNPLRPCLIWMDRRAQDEVKWVKNNIDEKELLNITGNYIDSYYGYSKILWIRDKEKNIWDSIKYFVTPYAYCTYKLTGSLYFDYCSAGNVGGIFDARKHELSQDMLDALGIPRSFFPDQLVDSSEIVGYIDSNGAKLTGLLKGTPVGAGGVDCVVATLSSGAIDYGEHAAMIGTSMAWGFIHEGTRFNQEVISMPFVLESAAKTYSFAGATTSGGIVKWYTNEFSKLEKMFCENSGTNIYQILEIQSKVIRPGCDGLIMLPHFMGERAPVWNADARGMIYGLTLYHTSAHIYRAIMESVAYSLKRCLVSAKNLDVQIRNELTLVGGITKSELWKHIIADVTGSIVKCAAGDGEAAYGDAFLAAICTGAIDDYREIKNWVSFNDSTEPDLKNKKIYSQYYQAYDQLYRTLEPIMGELACLSSDGVDYENCHRM